MFSHGGVDEGFQAMLLGYSRIGKGAVVMTNGNRGLALIPELLRSVAAVYAWPTHQARAVNVVAIEPALLEEYAADYQLGILPGPRGRFAIRRDGDHLVFSQAGGEPGELVALSQTSFIHESGESRVTFHRDDAGSITEMTIYPEADPETAGIGLGFDFAAPSGDPVVNRVLEGNAAARDGRIKVGDRLVGIENAAGALVELRGKSPAQVAGLIQGPDGTNVKLIVRPKDSEERVAIELTRSRIGIVARRVKTGR
jgi:hypothetical protein